MKVIGSRSQQQKAQNSLLPQCTTSIGNNSGYIENIVVKSAYSMGVTAASDRMVWPPSLSRDWKYTHPRVVCLRSEGNLVRSAFWSAFVHVHVQYNLLCPIYLYFVALSHASDSFSYALGSSVSHTADFSRGSSTCCVLELSKSLTWLGFHFPRLFRMKWFVIRLTRPCCEINFWDR